MKKLITLITLLCIFFSYSQTKEEDSLTIQLAFQKADTAKVITSLQLIKVLYKSEAYDKALQFISQSEKLANTLNFNEGPTIAEITYYKALIYAKKDDYINAIDNYSKSKELYITLKDTLGVAKINNSIGLIELERGNYAKGLQYSLRAIKDLERLDLKNDLCSAYKNLAKAYYKMKDYDKAIEFNLKTLDLEGQLNRTKDVISTNIELAGLYSLKNDHLKAINYYESVLDNVYDGNDSLKTIILPKLGGAYLQIKNLDKSTEHLTNGLRLNRKAKNEFGVLSSLNDLGDLYLQRKKLQLSERLLYEATTIAEKIKDDYALLRNYRLRTMLDSVEGNYRLAYNWQNKYFYLKNQLNQKALDLKIKESENFPLEFEDDEFAKRDDLNNQMLSSESEKKNQEKIDRLKLITYGLLAAFAIALTFLMLIYLKRKSRLKYTQDLLDKNIKIELQNEAILEQSKHLEDINKVKDRLFSIVSHDLKDSLTSIKGFIDLLKDGSLTNDEFNNLVPELSENANNASLLLFNLLNWSKSQMQSLEPNPSLFDVQEVFAEKIQLLEHKIETKGINLEDKTLRDFVYADRSMVEIIIQNILTNAVKFCKAGDTITLSNHISSGNSVIGIADTGVGISNENIDKLFKNNTFTTIGTKDEKGTGLGLTICKELVELNHGKIWVESAINQGSTFYVQLPKTNPVE